MPFKQVRALISGDLGHLRSMPLLPFAAAADRARLTLKCLTKVVVQTAAVPTTKSSCESL